MKPTVAVFIPVLDRPHRVEPLLDSLHRSYDEAAYEQVSAVFVGSPGDRAQLAAVQREVGKAAKTGRSVDLLVVDWTPGRGDYAKKMNYAWRKTDHDWVLLAADDLVFHLGWLEEVLRVADETNACVIGTNDRGNQRVVSARHSTHSFVSREYAECGTVDDPTILLHEGYWHNFVDDEFVQTAMARETWAMAADCVIEHLHPNWGKAPLDPTYQRGQARFDDDRVTFGLRKHLWSPAGTRRSRLRV